MRRLLKLALAVWLLRWAVIELASYAGRHWSKPGPAPIDSQRAPGHRPGREPVPGTGNESATPE